MKGYFKSRWLEIIDVIGGDLASGVYLNDYKCAQIGVFGSQMSHNKNKGTIEFVTRIPFIWV